MNHTPGPWWNESGVIHAKAPWWTEECHAAVHPLAAHVQDGIDWETSMANADLAAAAPDLLVALEAVEWVETWAGVEFHGRRSCLWCQRYEQDGHASDCPRQLALAKARGEE